MNARERLAEAAADETASVYAAPRGRRTPAMVREQVDAHRDDLVSVMQRREALSAAMASVVLDDYGHVIRFPGAGAA